MTEVLEAKTKTVSTLSVAVTLDIETSKTGELFLIGSFLLKKVLPLRLSAPLQAWVFRRYCKLKLVK